MRGITFFLPLLLTGCASQQAVVYQWPITNAAEKCSGKTACSQVYDMVAGVPQCNVWLNSKETQRDEFRAAVEGCLK